MYLRKTNKALIKQVRDYAHTSSQEITNIYSMGERFLVHFFFGSNCVGRAFLLTHSSGHPVGLPCTTMAFIQGAGKLHRMNGRKSHAQASSVFILVPKIKVLHNTTYFTT